MSLVEFLVIVFISLGVFDKSKILSYYQKLIKLQKGQERLTVGDSSIEESWIWIEQGEEE
ncbi:MAG: hypothetical protein ACJ0GD_01955 [Candidatus Actinomarina sp.]|jgi:hypothetical protein|nr:hypothetical protein [Candidatus Actinomarina sp.]OUX07153.1 MAG: hypothetical protein CBE04_00705 [Acidimicrobiaceae bacterium TMED244]|tara:strand:- start:10 stop:189 length:180 start_codon:yes stop_codon:yes gene_type:complete